MLSFKAFIALPTSFMLPLYDSSLTSWKLEENQTKITPNADITIQ
jgi:hypothetical protein